MAGLIVHGAVSCYQRTEFPAVHGGEGDLEMGGTQYPRMQMLLAVQKILDVKRFDTPGVAGRGLAQLTLPGTLD